MRRADGLTGRDNAFLGRENGFLEKTHWFHGIKKLFTGKHNDNIIGRNDKGLMV
jgi:hypothetical protein